MPLVARLLLLAYGVLAILVIQLLEQLGADSADLLVRLTLLADIILGIQDWVDMQRRGGRLSSDHAETLNQFFLEIICEIVLSAKEDHASGGDFRVVSLMVAIRILETYWCMPALLGAHQRPCPARCRPNSPLGTLCRSLV
jgi:hypothetical protein